MAPTSSKIYDVIIVGAGISGLYTGRCLTKEGLDVLILEARDHVGGRALTIRDPRFDYVDVGGAYFGEQQTKILELAKELGIEMYHLGEQGKAVLSIEGKRILFTEDDLPANYFLTLLDLNSAIQTLDKMSKEIPLLEPWNAPRAKEWDNINVEDFVKTLCWTSLGRTFLQESLPVVFGSDMKQLSLLMILHLARGTGGFRALLSSTYGLQAMKVKGGSNTFSEKMADNLEDHIKLKSVVRSIDQRGDVAHVGTHHGEMYKARQVVVAMSPPILKHIEFLPDLTDRHYHYINYKARSSEFKTVMYYKKAYWLDKGLKGEFVSIEGVARYGLADTKPDGRFPAILGFVDGYLWGHLSPAERKKKLAEQYAEIFGIPEMNEPTDYVERHWEDDDGERYSGICVYSLPPGFLTKHKVLWGESMDKVHFAGAEASVIMHGYMDGGLRAGEAAVVKVLKSLGQSPKHHYDTEVKPIRYLPTRFIEKIAPSVPAFLATVGMVTALATAWVIQRYIVI